MSRRPSRRIANPVARRIAEIVADCNYGARRSVQRDTAWVSWPDTTPTRPGR